LEQFHPSIRKLSTYFVYYSGFLSLWRKVANGGRPVVIYYHEVFDRGDDVRWWNARSLLSPLAHFRAQIEYLSRRYRIVSLNEAVASPPARTVAITFDDGYRGVYRHAFPVLKERHLPATIFLSTDFINSAQLPWWEVMMDQVRGFRALPIEKRSRLAAKLPLRWKRILAGAYDPEFVLSFFKFAPSKEREEFAGIMQSCPVPGSRPERIFLSAEEIREMALAGIAFGSHTRSHPILTWIDDERLDEEVRGSKEEIRRLTGIESCWFSYPDGIFSVREEKVVRDAGYTGAVQTFRVPDQSDRFAIPRTALKGETMKVGGKNGCFVPMIEVRLSGLSRRRIRKVFQMKRPTG
jgi:peptidoglycan/xylan/chitin deacetylase (PgdA/CDA1 family)